MPLQQVHAHHDAAQLSQQRRGATPQPQPEQGPADDRQAGRQPGSEQRQRDAAGGLVRPSADRLRGGEAGRGQQAGRFEQQDPGGDADAGRTLLTPAGALSGVKGHGFAAISRGADYLTA
jgi:hypothetical protein